MTIYYFALADDIYKLCLLRDLVDLQAVHANYVQLEPVNADYGVW